MIVVVGTVCVDRVSRISKWPERGGYADIESTRIFPGGEALNTAVGLVRLGADVVLVGSALAEDEEGDLVRNFMAREGLRAQCATHPVRTPSCDVFVDDGGERTMLGNGFLDLAEYGLPDLPEAPAGTWVTVEPNLGPVAREVWREAARRGWRRYAMDFWRSDDPLAPGDWHQTSTDWVGFRGDREGLMAWLETQRSSGVSTVVTDGAHGLAILIPDEPVRWVEAWPSVEPLDSTGAGDQFRAGMLWGLDSGMPVAEALRWGMACGALNCRSEGGCLGAATRSEVEALGRR